MSEPMTDERLGNENSDTLTEERLEWLRGKAMFSSHAEWAFGVGSLIHAYDRLRADNERLRKSLQAIADNPDSNVFAVAKLALRGGNS